MANPPLLSPIKCSLHNWANPHNSGSNSHNNIPNNNPPRTVMSTLSNLNHAVIPHHLAHPRATIMQGSSSAVAPVRGLPNGSTTTTPPPGHRHFAAAVLYMASMKPARSLAAEEARMGIIAVVITCVEVEGTEAVQEEYRQTVEIETNTLHQRQTITEPSKPQELVPLMLVRAVRECSQRFQGRCRWMKALGRITLEVSFVFFGMAPPRHIGRGGCGR